MYNKLLPESIPGIVLTKDANMVIEKISVDNIIAIFDMFMRKSYKK